MNNKTCFLIGNRYTPGNVRKNLADVVEKHIIEYGVRIFTVGHYGNFDSMAQSVLKDTKKQYTDLELYLLAPYALSQKIETPKGFNGIFYPDGLENIPFRLAILKANRYMIKNSDYLISYCHHIGNTRNIVEYAQKREKKGLIKITLL